MKRVACFLSSMVQLWLELVVGEEGGLLSFQHGTAVAGAGGR